MTSRLSGWSPDVLRQNLLSRQCTKTHAYPETQRVLVDITPFLNIMNFMNSLYFYELMAIPTFYVDPCFLNCGSRPSLLPLLLLSSGLFLVWKMTECQR